MAKRQTKNKRKRSVLAPSPPQMVILRVCMVLLALLLAAITLLNRGSDTVMNTAYPRKYDEYVTYYAGKYQIDPYILYSIIRTESNFNPQAESNVGARGLMQITEITFDWIKTKIAPDEPLTFDDLYDPEVNIRFGSYFISYCLQRYDDDLATARFLRQKMHNGKKAWNIFLMRTYGKERPELGLLSIMRNYR